MSDRALEHAQLARDLLFAHVRAGLVGVNEVRRSLEFELDPSGPRPKGLRAPDYTEDGAQKVVRWCSWLAAAQIAEEERIVAAAENLGRFVEGKT